MRKSAARSITRTPASSSAGACSIATPLGVAKKTASQACSGARGRILEFQIQASAQARKHARDVGAGVAPRSDGNDLHLRVLRQQAQQFDTGVAGAADDSDLDHEPPR
jgi:hypothetical protein